MIKENPVMKMTINTIIGERLYRGLLIGAPRDSYRKDAIEDMKIKLGEPQSKHLAILFNKNIFTPLNETTGTWGNIGGSNLTFSGENGNMYDVSIIWRYANEFESIEESLNSILSTFDWMEIADKWDIGDL